jgi:DNA-directed RNA polymerase specialized sigma24 family protein
MCMPIEFNYLCFDLTPLRPMQRRLFHLHAAFGLSATNLAEVFELPLVAVARTLRRAQRRYERTYRDLRMPWKS